MMTFGEFREKRASDVVGVCSNKETFRQMTNEAVERLMVRGGFWGTVGKLSTCVRCQSIVWPRQVAQVLAVNLCGRHTNMTGYWQQWLPMGSSDYQMLWPGWGLGAGWGIGGGIGWGTCGDVIVRQEAGEVPVQMQLRCGHPRYIRAYPSYQADIGKTETFFGIDDNGQEIFTKRDDGTWRPGVVLTLASPFVGTSFLVREVTRVLKDATMGPVRNYAYDAVNDVLEDLAIYQPSERSPSFAHSTVRRLRRGGSCNGLTSVTALVKMRFIAVESDEDVVQIDNWPAIKLMMLSIRAEDAGDTDEALRLQARAVVELNREIRIHVPEDQIPISITPFGSATPRSLGVGCIV